ncbi:restriction modification system DNA specificity domain protein [Cyanobacterium stanieri PCC 7202]|uniref:Restriction modification system DNA specificity domain protein n=1 Tax=Cyanobacterium stanieri (strain ATCC 29140 / PCC 7202) TaxID=292563 RepID=K9YK05_CYASC|nr:restriction modification system DNA specificity domain protein [Cyanobacterium stanieri PCC 7202]
MQILTLKEVSNYIRGITFKPTDVVVPYSNDSVVCFRTKNIQNTLDESDLIAVPPNFVKRDEQYVKKGDLLISSANSWNLVGKTCYVYDLSYKATAGGFISILRANESLMDSKYLYYWLSSKSTQHYVRLCGRQTTNISNLDTNRFLGLSIPVPPIAHQRRIADILDTADRIIQKRKRAIALTEELQKSIFLDMFGDPVTNPKGWSKCHIQDIAKVKTGKTPSRKETNNYGGSIRWVKTTEVINSVIEDTEEYLTEKGASQMTIFPKESIIVAMYGQGKTRGRTALLGNPSATNQACAVILPNTKYSTIYLWELLKISYNTLRELGRGGNQPNLNLNMIKTFEISFPPLEYQKKFDSIVHQIQIQKNKSLECLKESENLFNSLSQKAFKGEL